jgi:hypothetical protein
MLDRFDGSCEHEPEYQTNGHCVRCAMVTSLDEFRRSMGAPAYRGPEGRLTTEPFRLLDRAFTGTCVHEPQFQVFGSCIRCGMITSPDEAFKAGPRAYPGQAPFPWQPAPDPEPARPGGQPRPPARWKRFRNRSQPSANDPRFRQT